MTDSHDTDDRSRADPAQGPAHDLPVFELLVSAERTCMFTTVEAEGKILSRPMTVQRRDGATVWFMAFSDSPKVDQLAQDSHVNLVFADGDTWVSASGTGVTVNDDAKKTELWNKFTEAWFQCEPTDPKVALIRVDLSGGEYWESPNKPMQIIGLAKTLIAGERPDDGENAKLDLA